VIIRGIKRQGRRYNLRVVIGIKEPGERFDIAVFRIVFARIGTFFLDVQDLDEIRFVLLDFGIKSGVMGFGPGFELWVPAPRPFLWPGFLLLK
jgi:hypothetical protein